MLHELDDLSNNDLTDSSQDNWSFPDFSKFSNKKIRSRLGRRKLSNNEQKEVMPKTDAKYNEASNGFPWSQLNSGDKFEEHPSNCVTHSVSSLTGFRSVPNQCSKPPSNQNTLKDIGNIVKGCTKIHEVKVIDSSDDSSKENIKYILNNSFLCEDTTKTESSCMVSDLSLNSSENKHLYDTLPFKTPVKSFYNDDYMRPCTPNPLDGILDPESDSSFDVGNSCSRTHFVSFEGDLLKTSFSGKNVSGIKKPNKNDSPNNILQNVSSQDVRYSHVGNYNGSFLKDNSLYNLSGDKNNSNFSAGSCHDREVSPNLDTPDSSVQVPVKSQEIVEGQLVLYKSETLITEIKLKNELEKNCKLQLFEEVLKLPFDQNGQLVVYKSPPVVFEDVDKSTSDDNDKMPIKSTHGVPPSEENPVSNESIKSEHNCSANNDILVQQNTKISSCQNVNPTIDNSNKIITDAPLNIDKQKSKPVQPPLSFLNKSENKHNDFLSNVLFNNKHVKTSNDKFSKTPYYFQTKPMVPVGASIKNTLQEARIGSLVPPRVLHLNQADPVKSFQHNTTPSFDKTPLTSEAKSKIDKVCEATVKSNSLSLGNKINPISVKPELEKPLNTPSVQEVPLSNVTPLLSRPSPPMLSTVNRSAAQLQANYNLPKAIQDNMMSKGLMSNAINHQEHVTPAQKLSAVKLSLPTSQLSSGNDVFKKPFAVPPPPVENLNKPNNKLSLNTLLMNEEKPLDPRRPQDIVVKGTSYTALSVLGRGGSSVVYQVMDPQTSQLMAVKCVDLSSVDGTIANGYLNEVHVLDKLQGCQSVIKMFNYEYVKENKLLYVVMERGDTDLAKLIKDITKTKQMSMSMIIFYWTEMLSAVKDIHDTGIIHSDLKPANFLLVSGRLKLIDFGIASSLQGDMTSVIKDSTAGTFNYMSPEAINCNSENQGSHKISYKSDVWSLGCILYSLLFGKSPYSHIGHMWSKLRAIVDPSCHPPYPSESESIRVPFVMNLALHWCLLKDPKRRPTVTQLLSLPYCDPPVSEDHRLRIKSEIYSYVVEMFPESTFDFL